MSTSADPPSLLQNGVGMPRPVLFSLAGRTGFDLYHVANILFVTCAVGYLLADFSRVAYPSVMINEVRGSNVTNAWFMFFSYLVVLDCGIYFLCYHQWETEALEAASQERRIRGISEVERAQQLDDDEDEENEQASMLGGSNGQPSSSSDGPHKRRKGAGEDGHDSTNFAHRLLSESNMVARRARWCFFSHEGGLVNVLEIIAAFLFAVGATMTFFAGVAQVEPYIQRRWDAATMTGDCIASAIWFADSVVFHHIYTRTLRQQAKAEGRTLGPMSCIQANDPYFWTSILNLLATCTCFIGATWGITRQQQISSSPPDLYNELMLPMVQNLHAIYFSGDFLYVLAGSILVYAYSRDRRLASELNEAPSDPSDHHESNGNGLGMTR